ncbi:MAG TPA: hypothetical protein VGP82_14380 [Ktedonobacterales bacterium]|nr:hypothetical protein [Ktedonobacterales bacterium]
MASQRKRGHANGEGGIRLKPDGRWEARYHTPDGKRHSLMGKSRAEAAAKLTKALHDLAHGVPIVAEKQTVAEYLTWWLGTAAHDLAPRTLRRYRNHVHLSLIPALGRYRLAKLGPQPIQALYTKKLDEGAAPASVRQMHAVLRRALGEAARLGLVATNAATLVKVPRAIQIEMQVLSPDQARAFLVWRKGSAWRRCTSWPSLQVCDLGR